MGATDIPAREKANKDTTIQLRGPTKPSSRPLSNQIVFDLKPDDVREQKRWLIHIPEDRPPLCLVKSACEGNKHWLIKCPERADRKK